ncbi:MAG: glycosyltransferase [Planctomycetota bacterium]
MDPQVSIVVVTSDRLVDLRRCLLSLRSHLRAPGTPHAEVRTVHAPHDTAAMAMVRTEFPEVHVHTAGQRHISVQRNLGARAARGAVVVYLDDDAWPHPGWLSQLWQAFADERVVAASGPVQRGDGSMQCERLASSPIGRLVPLTAGEALPVGFAPSFSGCNLALRRRTLFACGGFDENLSYQPDDMDVTARLFAHVGRDPGAFRYCDLARVTHESSPGPYRRTLEDRAWFVVARDNLYYACRHAGVVRGLLGGVALQLPKLGRFVTWWWHGKLGLRAALRCFAKHLLGTLAGLGKGLLRGPRLPLEPLPEAPPSHDDGPEALPAKEPSCRRPQPV